MNFTKPYDGVRPITSEFGSRRFQLSDGSWYSDFHNAIDIGGQFDVKAAESGRVIALATNGIDRGGALVSGTPANYVIIDHGGGYRTIYWHLQTVNVYLGQEVSKGQKIGYSGRTGEATGFHLHFGISVNGVYLNPRNFVDFNSNNSNNSNMENFITVQGGWGLSHVALAAGYADYYAPSAWERIYNLNQGFRGSQNWEQLNARIGAGDQLRVREDSKPTPTPESNLEAVKKEMQAKFDKEKQDLIIKHQQEIDALNEADELEKKQYEEKLKELTEKYNAGELKSQADIAAAQTRINELQKQIDARKEIKLSIAGLDVNELGLHILNLAIEQKGIKAKWHAFVDRIFPSEGGLDTFLRGVLKFDIAWIIYFIVTGLVSVLTVFQAYLSDEQKILIVILSAILGFLGTVVKYLTTNVDKNKDGKIDLMDTEFLKDFAKK